MLWLRVSNDTWVIMLRYRTSRVIRRKKLVFVDWAYELVNWTLQIK